jgi:hypothetical protein
MEFDKLTTILVTMSSTLLTVVFLALACSDEINLKKGWSLLIGGADKWTKSKAHLFRWYPPYLAFRWLALALSAVVFPLRVIFDLAVGLVRMVGAAVKKAQGASASASAQHAEVRAQHAVRAQTKAVPAVVDKAGHLAVVEDGGLSLPARVKVDVRTPIPAISWQEARALKEGPPC